MYSETPVEITLSKWRERTKWAFRLPRKPDCLTGGGRGLRHAAQAPRCSLIRSASLSLGGSSVSSLTRLPYLQMQQWIIHLLPNPGIHYTDLRRTLSLHYPTSMASLGCVIVRMRLGDNERHGTYCGPVSLDEDAEEPLPGARGPSAPARAWAARLPGPVPACPDACQCDSGGARNASSGAAWLKGAGPCTMDTRHLSSMACLAATTSGASLDTRDQISHQRFGMQMQ